MRFPTVAMRYMRTHTPVNVSPDMTGTQATSHVTLQLKRTACRQAEQTGTALTARGLKLAAKNRNTLTGTALHPILRPMISKPENGIPNTRRSTAKRLVSATSYVLKVMIGTARPVHFISRMKKRSATQQAEQTGTTESANAPRTDTSGTAKAALALIRVHRFSAESIRHVLQQA